jgi:branched-subunit amino acid aminotransferase/4-amino-4-deoxychorismate lyase
MTPLARAVSGRGIVDPGEPVLRADDEAVLRGRAAFETLRVYDLRPFRLEAHLDRLAASAESIGLPPLDAAELERLAGLALAEAAEPSAVLRLVWTPGSSGGEPLGLALVTALPVELEQLRARGLRVVTLLGVRAEAPWLLPGVKSTSYAVNMAAEAEARRRGADDAVFLDRDGTVLEGPVTNVWWRRGGTLFTPSLDLGILAGVTRAAVLELARGKWDVVEGRFGVDDLRAADEAFTSSSVRELMPIVELDGDPLARGPAADELQRALRAAAAVDDQVRG